jgi:phosphotransferase system IIA component
MSESLRIKGQFFNNRTELDFSPTKGYKPIKKVVARNAATFLFSGLDKEILDIVQHGYDTSSKVAIESTKSPTLQDFPICEMQKLLGFKIAVLECNFDKWNFYCESSIKHYEPNFPKNFSKLKIDDDNLWSAMMLAPIIPSNLDELKVNATLIDYYLQQITNLDNNVEVVVVTGEMLWSGWITESLLHKTISKIFERSTYLYVDQYALVHNIIQDGFNNKIIKKISASTFAPNVFYYVPNDKEKVVVLSNEEEKREIFFTISKNNVYQNVRGLSLKDNLLPDKLIIRSRNLIEAVGVNFDYILKHSRFQSFNKQEAKVYKGNLQIECDLNTNFSVEEVLGYSLSSDYKVIDLHNLPGQFKSRVTNGEKVKKGEVIVSDKTLKGKILGDEYLSPVDGVVDMRFVESGVIIIKYNEGREVYLSKFAGRLTKKLNNKYYEAVTSVTSIPTTIAIGAKVSGILTNDLTIKGDKIFVIDDLAKFKFDSQFIITNEIKGLVLLRVSYNEIKTFLRKYSYMLDFLSLFVVDAYTDDINIKLKNFLSLYNNYLVTLEDKKLIIFNNGFIAKDFIQTSEREDSLLGKEVQLLSYFHKFRYYKVIRKLTESRYLLSNGKEIVESELCNLLLL